MFPVTAVVFAMGQGGAGGSPGGAFAQFIPLILIFAIFWFLIIRPQQRKAKQHRQMVSELRKGDEVITDSGFQGTIQKVADDFITLEIAPKVQVRLVRARVAEVMRPAKGGGQGGAQGGNGSAVTDKSKEKEKAGQ